MKSGSKCGVTERLKRCLFFTSWVMAAFIGAYGCKKKSQMGLSSLFVVGGQEDNSSFPATVMIKASNICTGAFISPRIILTAAHCVNGQAANSFTIFSTFGSPVQVSSIISHPSYSGGVSADLALFTLENDYAPIHAIASIARTQASTGEAVTMVGYGYDNRDELSKQSGVGLEKRRIGKNKISFIDPTMELVIDGAFANDEGASKGASILPGDSGGALYGADGSIVGVVSKYGTNDTKSYFVDLSSASARSFIESAIGGHVGDNKGEQIQRGGNESLDGGCSYEDAYKNNGWGYNKYTGQSCPPIGAGGGGQSDRGCSYEDAYKYNGWGFNKSTGQSCPPQVGGNFERDCSYEDAYKYNGWGYNKTTGLSCPPR